MEGRFKFKKLLPRTLLGRSLMILITPIILIQLISIYMFYDRHWGRMTDRLAFAVAGEIAIIVDEVEDGGDPADLDRLAGYAAQNLNLLVGFEPGAEFSGRVPEKYLSPVAEALHQAVEKQVRRPHIIEVDRDEKWVMITLGLDNGVMHISLPERRLFSSSGHIFLLWVLGTSIILLSIAILFMRNQIRPIRRLSVAVERFGRGLDVPASFKPEGAHEVRQATRAFLDMHERIKRQIGQRTAMLAGVSHDLRTPLTRMKLQVAMMPPSADVAALRSDLDDMERMLNAYLDFARGEGGEQAARMDLTEILERMTANMRRQGLEIDLKIDGDMYMQARPIAIERCLANIVGNARKYADQVWVHATRRDDDHIQITVDDNGPGIPEDQFDEVFKPFVRGEPSRNPATGGVGLGLPIAQDIITAHGGRIWLEKSPHGGLRVLMEFPV